ncbi:MAG: FecR domain-containing protein [Candidatus Pseudobacter hemicellulosilyticus]|uniref:FecR domain-containing protein n=1 Tax=Candidatus Pseudobacter hemicellulosilyticus TaxID=3121375 RepID=A0AAJ5WQW4_9BACT|nr:MAG: FecR domain-containing protein [Pseudobacter sp.]
MEKERLQQLIDKVLSGQASVQEQRELDQWYAAQEANPGLTEGLSEQRRDQLGKQLFQSIEGQVKPATPAEEAPALVHMPPRSRKMQRWIAAAGVLLLLSVGAFYFYYRSAAETAQPIAWQQYKADTSVLLVRLPDRSQVWLNAGSSLRFDSAFSNGKREFWLEGEAYFDVQPLASQPFEVHTRQLTTKVLGTAFNIDAYKPDTAIAVTVTKGKVAVSDSSKELGQLLPDQRLICHADGSVEKDSTTARDYTAWTSDQLVFRNMTYKDVARRLERRFGIELWFRNPKLEECLITGSFDARLPLQEILDMIALTNGSDIGQSKLINVYFITGEKKCK